MSNHFKIIVPFYNVEKWIKICIRSLKAQDYNDYECILIDDISTDKSAAIVKKEIGTDKRFRLVSNKEKSYALKNIYDAIELSNPAPEDIIVTLDGDDWLASSSVLSYLSDFYSKERCWLTYGSYAEYPSGIKGKFARQIPKHIIDSSLYRNAQWMTSHLRTFKYHLWSKIDAKDMKDKAGNFYQMAWDLSFMLPMLEMSVDKHRYIDEILYIYNRTNPLNDDKVDHRKQLGFEQEIRNKTKYLSIKSGQPAVAFMSSNRFDIAAKTFYAKKYLSATDSSFHIDMYLAHLKVWNNFYERAPEKKGPNSFLESFNALLESIKSEGFNATVGKVPTINGSALNGAHRIAGCIALGEEIESREGEISEGQYLCNFEYFRDKKDFVETGLSEIYLDEMALEFCRNKKNLYTITLFPSHEYPMDKILSHISKKSDVIYYKKISLSKKGQFNYIHNLYHNEAWVGSKNMGYPGVLEKAKLCFTNGGDVVVVLVEESNASNMPTLKDEIRSMCAAGKHSVHINDTQEETWRIATSAFNNNSLHYLNNKKMIDTPNFDSYIKNYHTAIKDREDFEDFCVDSSATLSAYGLRDCRDLDFLHLKDVAPISYNVECHNLHTDHYRQKKDDIIYNPKFHFYAHGIKFAAIDVVKKMKMIRDEEKDRNDVALMAALQAQPSKE